MSCLSRTRTTVQHQSHTLTPAMMCAQSILHMFFFKVFLQISFSQRPSVKLSIASFRMLESIPAVLGRRRSQDHTEKQSTVHTYRRPPDVHAAALRRETGEELHRRRVVANCKEKKLITSRKSNLQTSCCKAAGAERKQRKTVRGNRKTAGSRPMLTSFTVRVNNTVNQRI